MHGDGPAMKFSHVFISRPRAESKELAALLSPLGLQAIIQPAFTYAPLDARAGQSEEFAEMEAAVLSDLLLFTSPRAVANGLSQLPANALHRSRVAAIGPATASALSAAGIKVNVTPRRGYTSEALLETLAGEDTGGVHGLQRAFIIAAPGGRKKLKKGLRELGCTPRMIYVYKPEPADLDKQELGRLKDASGVLSVWTSANTMKALSHRLPPAMWFQLCQGEWLVISERLKRLARAYGPGRVHLAAGPGNTSLVSAIRNLV